MGLERIAAVLQGVHDNYDIDLFKALIAASVDLTGVKAEGAQAPSHRVIADHLRSSSFLLADGVTPSNEGRGYVLRRIMRRAMRHAYLLGASEPLMHRLAPTLVAEMGQAYPELRRAEASIVETLRQEEERFRVTLGRGMGLLDEATANLAAGGVLDGETAFKLYDTYGFPLDLTQDAVRAKGITVDTDGFDVAMRKSTPIRMRPTGATASYCLDIGLILRLAVGSFAPATLLQKVTSARCGVGHGLKVAISIHQKTRKILAISFRRFEWLPSPAFRLSTNSRCS